MKTLLVGHSTEWSGTGVIGARSQNRWCCCSLPVAVVITTCADLFYRAWALSALTPLRIKAAPMSSADFALLMIAVTSGMAGTIGFAGLLKESRDMVLGFFYWSAGAAVLSFLLQAYSLFGVASECEWSWDEDIQGAWTKAPPRSYSTEAEFISTCVHRARFVLGITLLLQSVIRALLLHQLHAMSVVLRFSGSVDFHTVRQVFTSFARTPTAQAAAAAATPALAMQSLGPSTSLQAASSSSSSSSPSTSDGSLVSIGLSAHPPFLSPSSQSAITFSSSSPKSSSSSPSSASAASATVSSTAAAGGVAPTLMMVSPSSMAPAAAPPRRPLPLSAYSNNVPLPPPLPPKVATGAAAMGPRFGFGSLSSFAPDDGL